MQPDLPHRRRFLRDLGGGVGMSNFGLSSFGLAGFSALNGRTASAAESTSKPRARACILLYMDGGPSQLDLWDMKPLAPEDVRGPFRSVATSVPDLHFSELLPRVAKQAHRLTLIRSMCHTETVHDPAVYQMLTGYKHISSAGGLKVEETDAPQFGTSFGRVDRSAAAMPKVIQLPETMKMDARVLPGQHAGFLGRSWDPFYVEVTKEGDVIPPDLAQLEELPPARVGARQSLLARLGKLARIEETDATAILKTYQEQALAILGKPRVQRAFQIEDETPALRDKYGRHRHGQSVLLARRLVEAGARFVTVYWGRENQDWADGKGMRPANNPWDTHRNHFPIVRDDLTPRADQTLAALLEDLSDRGLLDSTLVLWMGDFGRTPKISRPWASRDHWPGAFSLVMAGAGLPGGYVLGSTDRLAAEVTDRPVHPNDLTATVFQLLGVDAAATVADARGRPFQISTGKPIAELLG